MTCIFKTNTSRLDNNFDEQYAEMQEVELEALASMMEDRNDINSSGYGTDEDEDYERLLMEALLESERATTQDRPPLSQNQQSGQDLDMDVTMG